MVTPAAPTQEKVRDPAGATALGVFGELLVTAGVVLLLFVAWQLWWTDVVADRAQERIVSRLESRFAQDPAPGAVGGNGIPAVEGAGAGSPSTRKRGWRTSKAGLWLGSHRGPKPVASK